MNETDKQKKECDDIFLKCSTFWKLVVSGIVCVLGFGLGMFTWAMTTSNVDAVQSNDIKTIEKRVVVIESNFEKIDTKLSIIIDQTK
jgi:hypothetical protein